MPYPFDVKNTPWEDPDFQNHIATANPLINGNDPRFLNAIRAADVILGVNPKTHNKYQLFMNKHSRKLFDIQEMHEADLNIPAKFLYVLFDESQEMFDAWSEILEHIYGKDEIDEFHAWTPRYWKRNERLRTAGNDSYGGGKSHNTWARYRWN